MPPPAYIEGTQVNWTFNTRDHGYFRPIGWDSATDIFFVFFSGDGETNSTNYDNNVMAKWFKDSGTNWDGTVTTPNGTSKKIMLFSLNHPVSSGNYTPDYAADIEYAIVNAGVTIDTGSLLRMWIGGLSGGVGRGFSYLANDSSHNSPYRSCFGIGFWTSGTSVSEAYSDASSTTYNYVWHGGTTDNGIQNFKNNMETLYANLNGTKASGSTASGGHSSTTWDDFLAINGTTSATNRFIWAIETSGLDSSSSRRYRYFLNRKRR